MAATVRMILVSNRRFIVSASRSGATASVSIRSPIWRFAILNDESTVCSKSSAK